MNLAEAPLNTAWRILKIQPNQDNTDLAQQLEDIGFLPGELVSVLTHGYPGHDPLVVRVGLSTFALRRAEAQAIQLLPKANHA
jgi:ferrous iron transport protein A